MAGFAAGRGRCGGDVAHAVVEAEFGVLVVSGLVAGLGDQEASFFNCVFVV